ncbi:class C sortase [Enterococcus durans]|uniref:Class C sortase n=1 Tax=Enterococcus durans TaxID=53345 RepID=A0A5N0YTY5_9ENTE|nr:MULTISPECIES: class C sortase [Enterococcus]KAA9177437.1 class C sortase [Enterococcus durans]KAA9183998.1 class C sortase [Enterococcus durans]KAA9185125.1 class C sortase [Enterococcus durans]KAA9189301.1 class C sortase [Enterococcus durans]KAA9190904.1 class C sortase [Enterococcus durans]
MSRIHRYLDIFMVLVFAIGILFLVYPFISDTINDYLDQQIIANYQKQAERKNKEVLKTIREKYVEDNQKIAEKNSLSGGDPFDTEATEKQTKTYLEKHTVGVLTIPKIHVRLPIFDQTTSLLLEKGATLLEGTSYPVGGESTHAVLSSHRGLPKAKLFTDLDQLGMNDLFFIDSYGKRLVYEVDKIKIIEPTETDELLIEEGQDLVTLVTCTPYMVNSHRLLVRGHRIDYEKNKSEKIINQLTKQKKHQFYLVIVLFTLGIIGIGSVLIFYGKR